MHELAHIYKVMYFEVSKKMRDLWEKKAYLCIIALWLETWSEHVKIEILLMGNPLMWLRTCLILVIQNLKKENKNPQSSKAAKCC